MRSPPPRRPRRGERLRGSRCVSLSRPWARSRTAPASPATNATPARKLRSIPRSDAISRPTPLALAAICYESRRGAHRPSALHRSRGLRARLRGDAPCGSRDGLRGRRAPQPIRPFRRTGAGVARSSTGLELCGRHVSLADVETELPRLVREADVLGTRRTVLAWIEPPRLGGRGRRDGGAVRQDRRRGSRGRTRLRLPQSRRRAARPRRRTLVPRSAARSAALPRARSRLGVVRRCRPGRSCSDGCAAARRSCT